MAERPRDIALNEDKDVYLDDVNDLALVTGDDQLQQSIAIDVMDVTQQFAGRRITAQSVSLLEQRILEALEEDPQVGTIRAVSVEEFDQRNDTVTVMVSLLEEEDFTIEVTA